MKKLLFGIGLLVALGLGGCVVEDNSAEIAERIQKSVAQEEENRVAIIRLESEIEKQKTNREKLSENIEELGLAIEIADLKQQVLDLEKEMGRILIALEQEIAELREKQTVAEIIVPEQQVVGIEKEKISAPQELSLVVEESVGDEDIFEKNMQCLTQKNAIEKELATWGFPRSADALFYSPKAGECMVLLGSDFDFPYSQTGLYRLSELTSAGHPIEGCMEEGYFSCNEFSRKILEEYK